MNQVLILPGGKQAVHKMLLGIPARIEAERIYLRSYEAGDGQWYYAMSQKNRTHLARYEAEHVVMSIESEQDANYQR